MNVLQSGQPRNRKAAAVDVHDSNDGLRFDELNWIDMTNIMENIMTFPVASHVASHVMQRPGAPWGPPRPEELLHRLGFQVPPDLIDGDGLEPAASRDRSMLC